MGSHTRSLHGDTRGFFGDFNFTNSEYKFGLYKMRDRFAISARVKF